MPNFNKSKGFQLRSGNKAKAPFKMMGSSPAKGGFMDALNAFKGESKTKNLKAKEVKTIDTTKSQANTEKVKLGSSRPDGDKATTKTTDKKGEVKTKAFKNDASEPATDPNKGKHKDQIKKQAKLDKITARRERKGKEGLTDKQMKLQKQTSQTGEEYMKDKQDKKDAFRANAAHVAIELGNSIAGKPTNFQTPEQRESAAATTKRKQQNIEDYEAGKNDDIVAETVKTSKSDNNGDPALDEKALTVVQKVDLANEKKKEQTE